MNVGELLKALVGLDHLTEVVVYDDDIPGAAVLFPFRAGTELTPEDPITVFVIHGCTGQHQAGDYDHDVVG